MRLISRTHVTLLPVTETVAKLRITTLRRSMCQHLHTFTQQVSEAASYVFFACKHLEACAKRADGQTVGCPTALQVSVHAERSWATQQVLIPQHLSGLLASSLIHSLG